jgi:DNA-binding transcriptional regulator YiaG
LVHHARKSNGGAGSYRGSQKLSVTCNSIIRLEPNPDAAPDGGASFKMVWEKVRAKPSEEIKDRTVRLEDDRWIFEVSNSPEFTRFVTAIRSREFCSQDEVAQALNVTKSTISKWKKKAIAEGLITLEEINTCFEEAKQMNDEGDDNEEADF